MTLLLLLAPAVQAAELRARILDQEGQPLEDAAVLVEPLDGSAPAAAPPSAMETVDQVEKQFVPYVKVVRTGTMVRFPNNDNVRHQVYSFSPAKRFELPLYRGEQAEPVLFDVPGVVALGCNIHDWMVGYIYVTDAPWFATSDDEGHALVGELPPGRYRVTVWHPRMRDAEAVSVREMDIGAEGAAEAEWRLPLRPEQHVRRAPIGGQQGYR